MRKSTQGESPLVARNIEGRFFVGEIPGYDFHIAASAARDLEIADVDGFLRSLKETLAPVRVQAFNADRIAGWKHLYFATLFALKSFEQKANVSKDLALEVLINASCQRQILRAIEMIGLKAGRENVAFLLMASDPKALEGSVAKLEGFYGEALSPGLLVVTPEKMEELKRLFGIHDAQLASESDARNPVEALTNLIVERMTVGIAKK